MDIIDCLLINTLQDNFPICENPYQCIADSLNLTEQEVLFRLQSLLNEGILTRFGPLYHAELMGGALTLAALKVPTERFEEITTIVNAFPQVAHNYARTHELNMWFVIAVENEHEVSQVIQRIEDKTGLKVFNMPKIKEYFVGLKFLAEIT